MKILIVGGTGMIGAHTARHLREVGNDVTVAARNPLTDDSPVRDFPVLLGDYTLQTFTADQLAPFEAVVFAAGQDIRHMRRGLDAAGEAEFWEKTQSGGVPRFAALAKEAGVARFVQVGSYYHHLRPEYADTMPYVAARKAADEGARALADENFAAVTLNPPSILGALAGVSAKRYRKLFSWAAGNEPQIPDFAPTGGTNYMSARSLAEAIWGAVQRGESGKAYLIGDQNLTFAEYFQLIVDAAGGNRTIESRDEEHPLLPDSFIVQGRGNVISYDTDPAEDTLLAYTKNDCARALADMHDLVRAAVAAG